MHMMKKNNTFYTLIIGCLIASQLMSSNIVAMQRLVRGFKSVQQRASRVLRSATLTASRSACNTQAVKHKFNYVQSPIFAGRSGKQQGNSWHSWTSKICMGLGLTGLARCFYGQQVAHADGFAKQQLPPASMWQRVAQGHNVSRHEMVNHYIADCNRLAGENASIPTHRKNNETVRVATYNVHFWHSPDLRYNFDAMMQTIGAINPDILILQEVALDNLPRIIHEFNKLGFTYAEHTFYKAADYANSPFGNVIISKYPLAQHPINKAFYIDKHRGGEQRGYLRHAFYLPNNKKITIYGTHLDVHDETEDRRAWEVEELVMMADKDTSENIMIAADFNAVRARDYQYSVGSKRVWDMLSERGKQRTGVDLQTKALDLLAQHKFADCFAKHGQEGPKFTVWSGTAVDFMYLNQKWQLPIVGCYVHYSPASDHIPVIMDLKVK